MNYIQKVRFLLRLQYVLLQPCSLPFYSLMLPIFTFVLPLSANKYDYLLFWLCYMYLTSYRMYFKTELPMPFYNSGNKKNTVARDMSWRRGVDIWLGCTICPIYATDR